MSALETLPPDQRAVLQLVLQRGRSYDQIAGTLSIEREAVRQRALDALGALTPATVPPGPERALVTDYLLGQLPDRAAMRVYTLLQTSDGDRAWAQAVARELEPLTSGSLPEIPVGARHGADAGAAGGLEQGSDAPDPAQPAPVSAQPRPAPLSESRPSSRRGGAILLGTSGALIVAAIVVVVATSGGAKGTSPSSHHSGPGLTTQTAAQTTTGNVTTSTGVTTTATTGAAQILAQLNLKSPTGAAATLGVVLVERVDGVIGIVVDAQGIPANTPHNAYAVWLYNSPTSYRFVGFAPTLVGKNGRLVTEGRLKAWAAGYHRLLITLETRRRPTTPGKVALSGPFHGYP